MPKPTYRSPYPERRIVADRDDRFAADRATLDEKQLSAYRNLRGRGFKHGEAMAIAATGSMPG